MGILQASFGAWRGRGAYPKRSAVRHANGQIRKDGDESVGQRRAESQVVRDLVDGQEEVLVGGRADDVAQGPELPRPEGRVPQDVGAGELQGDDEGDDVLGQWLGPAELGDLEDGGTTRSASCLV